MLIKRVSGELEAENMSLRSLSPSLPRFLLSPTCAASTMAFLFGRTASAPEMLPHTSEHELMHDGPATREESRRLDPATVADFCSMHPQNAVR